MRTFFCFAFCLCISQIAAHAQTVQAPAAEADEFHFVVLGDAQFHDPAKFNRVIDQTRRLRPAFVIQVGDLIEGYNSDLEIIEEEWQRFSRQIAPLAPVPYYAVPGNHDVFNSERQVDPRLEDLYIKHWGPLYYTFVYKNTQVVVLNTDSTEGVNNITGKQWVWLQGVLRNSTAEHKILFMHRPPLLTTNGERLHKLFVEHGVARVFYGHHHHYHHFVRDGVAYTMTNAAANSVNDVEAVGGFHHILQVSIRGGELDVAVIKADGVKAEDSVAPIDNYDFYALHQRLAPKTVRVREMQDNVYQLVIPLRNSSQRDINVLISCDSADQRWLYTPKAITPVALDAGAESEVVLSLTYTDRRVPESEPVCDLRVPFQTTNGQWLEYTQQITGNR
ncbi:MAG: metallophosphoesterase family protein [bacterium]